MYSTCLHCHQSLGKNESIEHFPVGRRLAFDAAKGRLWVVCPHCARWNLTPIEERWEAVEECEREFREQRLRAQTDNIGLARLPEGTDLIRIGLPLRPEFAAWRYGGVFRRRFQRRLAVVAAGTAAVATGGLLLGGAPLIASVGPMLLLPFIHIGVAGVALRKNFIATKVVGENGKPLRVLEEHLNHTRIDPRDDGSFLLHLRHSYGTQDLTGDRATRALGSILSRVNRSGGSTGTIGDASRFIADAGDARNAIASVARIAKERAGDFEEIAADFARAPRGRTMEEAIEGMARKQRRASKFQMISSNGPLTNPGAFNHLPRMHRLALEMSLHETSEQFALEQDLALLERDWREAEEIAAIADNLLGPSVTTASAK